MTGRHELLGRYIAQLTPGQRKVCGARVDTVAAFLDTAPTVDREGLRSYAAGLGGLAPRDREVLNDFLRWCGVADEPEPELPAPKEQRGRTARSAADVSRFGEWLMRRREYSDSAIVQKACHMGRFFDMFDEFSQETCRSFIRELEAGGMSPRTVNLYMLTLRQWGEYSGVPVALRRIGVQRELSVENVPTADEVRRLMQACREGGMERELWMLRLLVSTGMRKSELLQVRWRDVARGSMTPRCKGNKVRRICFPTALRREARESAPGGAGQSWPVVHGKRREVAMSPRGVDWVLKAVARKAGVSVEKAHCHALRHFFAKSYLESSGDVVQLAELLGHESVETTRLYLRKSADEQLEDIDRNVTWL